MTRRRFAQCTCALALALLAGCGSGNNSSIEGTVTFDGAPLDGGAIMFVPEADPKNAKSGGAKIVKGKYAVAATKNGLVPGKYRVEITFNQPTGNQIKNPSDPGMTINETKQVIPDKYNKKTDLKVELKSGRNRDVNFDVKSK